jgi:enoyl-CoA hydratase/carnithine racemase
MAEIEARKDGGIATITLNRPERHNALTPAMMDGLRDALRAASADPDVRVLLLRAAGTHFTVGADIRVMQASSLEEFRRFVVAIQDVTRAIRATAQPVIVAIQGLAVGGGSELAVAGDLRIAAAGARLGFPEARLGITVTSGATHLLSRLVGAGRAKRLMLTGELLGAEEAERIGLVDRTVPEGRLEEEVRAVAEQIARCGPLAIRLTKRCIDWGYDAGLEATLHMEAEAILDAFVSQDAREGFRAFLEKRVPRFVGQ